MTQTLEQCLDERQKNLFAGLTSPVRIQAFLDETPYSTLAANLCPLRVIQEGLANCLDGALFAAAALRRLGFPALIVDMLPEPGTDDDHLLAVYQVGGAWGSLAKSNFAGLRSRQPVYRSLRELIMSYFELFYNVDGLRTLRGYTRPLGLALFDRLEWETQDRGTDAIEKHLYHLRPIPVLAEGMAAALPPMDSLTYQAGMLGVNPDGLYRPRGQ